MIGSGRKLAESTAISGGASGPEHDQQAPLAETAWRQDVLAVVAALVLIATAAV